MATWDRSTPWRQGAVLTPQAADAFELRSSRSPDQTVVVISHDCDLAQDPKSEPFDPYQLIITLLYSTNVDPVAAEQAALVTKKRIEEIFNVRCRAKNDAGVEEWRWIELQAVEVVSDETLTYAQSQLLTKWQADYISLRANPQQPIVVPT